MEYNPFFKGDIPYFNLLADISYVDKIQIPHFIYYCSLSKI